MSLAVCVLGMTIRQEAACPQSQSIRRICLLAPTSPTGCLFLPSRAFFVCLLFALSQRRVSGAGFPCLHAPMYFRRNTFANTLQCTLNVFRCLHNFPIPCWCTESKFWQFGGNSLYSWKYLPKMVISCSLCCTQFRSEMVADMATRGFGSMVS